MVAVAKQHSSTHTSTVVYFDFRNKQTPLRPLDDVSAEETLAVDKDSGNNVSSFAGPDLASAMLRHAKARQNWRSLLDKYVVPHI